MASIPFGSHALRNAESADKENMVAKSNANLNNKNANTNAGRSSLQRTSSALQTKSSNFIVFPNQSKENASNNTNSNSNSNSNNNNNHNGGFKGNNDGKLRKFNSMNNIGSGFGLGIGLDTLIEDIPESVVPKSQKLNIQIDNSLKKSQPIELDITSLPDSRTSKASKLLKDLRDAAIDEEEGDLSFDLDKEMSMDMDLSFKLTQKSEADDEEDSIEYGPGAQDPEISYIPKNAMPMRKSMLEAVFGPVNPDYVIHDDLFENEKDIDPVLEKEFYNMDEIDKSIARAQEKEGDILEIKFDDDDEIENGLDLKFDYDNVLPYDETKKHKSQIDSSELTPSSFSNTTTKSHTPSSLSPIKKSPVTKKRIPGYLASTAASRNKRYKPKRL